MQLQMQPCLRRSPAAASSSSRRRGALVVRAVLQQQRGTDTATTKKAEEPQTQKTQQAAPAPRAPPFRVGFKTEQGLRPRQEDEVDVEVDRENGYVFAGVYDGHGGTAAAKWLKTELYDRIKRELQSHAQGLAHNNPQVPNGLEVAFKAIDQTLLAHLEAQGGEELAQSGSTATVVMVWPDRAVAANVGDSGAYIWRNNQQMVQLTTPHRVYGGGPEMDREVQRIKSVGGWVYDGRVCNVLAVSRAFGDWEFKGRGLARLLPRGIERGYWDQAFADTIKFTGDPIIVTPESRDVALTPADEFMVVATDGLFDVFPAREAMQWARKELQRGYTPQEVSESLVNMATKRYTTDNTSVVVIDLKGEQYWHEMASKPRGPGAFLSGLFGR